MEQRIETEFWNGCEIRFIEIEEDNWWAVADDVADAMGYSHTPHMMRMVPDRYKSVRKVDSIRRRGNPNKSIISENGLIILFARSEHPEAENFIDFITDVIIELRKSIGLKGYQFSRLLDKRFQVMCMDRLRDSHIHFKNTDPERYYSIYPKANMIANKAVSSLYGYEKVIGKETMCDDMLRDRQPILDYTVGLMEAQALYNIDTLSISKQVYSRFCPDLYCLDRGWLL
jgi:prophage antirepressor-like protein